MGSPLLDTAERYLAKNRARFHMPGHKGVCLPPLGGALRYDLTEVPGLDSLYEASGPIAETEARYAKLYGAAGTILSAGGATLCIQTMLALAAKPGEKLLCARGVHTAAVNAMALLDLHPAWIDPAFDEATGLCRALTPEQVEGALTAHPDAVAVYLTSPDYFGVISDIAAISALCRRRGVPLLVDNAHGAHLRFLQPDLHPISLGADLCCDSLHKTLPVATGGALLHVSNERFLTDSKRKMSLFASTSPSYLIMLSVDSALPWLESQARGELVRVAARVAELQALALERGLLLPSGTRDPLRLSLGFAPLGHTAETFRAHLEACGVEPEYLAPTFCVFLAGAHNSDNDFARLRRAITDLPRLPASESQHAIGVTAADSAVAAPAKQAYSLREAMFAPCETVSIDRAEGRICAGFVAPCPPGIPLALPGELLDAPRLRAMKNSGILVLPVVK